MARWHSCNILHLAPDAKRLWQFDAKGKKLRSRPRAARAARRDAAGQIRRQKLVVALAAEIERRLAAVGKCFPARRGIARRERGRNPLDGRVAIGKALAHSRHANCLDDARAAARTRAQPRADGSVESLQTVVVVIASRAVVEEFLGRLEKRRLSRRPAGSADGGSARSRDAAGRRRVAFPADAGRTKRRAGGVVVRRCAGAT